MAQLIRSTFVMHPEQCEMAFVPESAQKHPILDGISRFVFPVPEEHYVMQFYDELPTTVLAYAQSQHGTQPALWVHEQGRGRVCCLTPAHNTESLTCEPFVRLLRQAAQWCTE